MLRHSAAQSSGSSVERRGPGLEPRQLEQVADEAVEPPRLLEHAAHVAGALVVGDGHGGVEQGLGVAADRGERRGQLVGDVGEELAALLLGLLDARARLGEPSGHPVEPLGHAADLVAAGVADAHREVALGHARRQRFHGAQAPHQHADHEEGDDERGDHGDGQEEQGGPRLEEAGAVRPQGSHGDHLAEDLGAAHDRAPHDHLAPLARDGNGRWRPAADRVPPRRSRAR